jgi:glucose-6-phosphate isomerase
MHLVPRREAREFSVPRLSSRHPRVLAAVAVLALSTGCGPFGYLKKVATDASRAVAEAEASEAEKYAPYEYWGAVAYLEQAKVLMGYSEYERSFDFGERAKQLANEAKVKAQRVKKGESVVRDENIAAPGDMVDQDGKPVETLEEAQGGGEDAEKTEAKEEPKKTEGKKDEGKAKKKGGAP